MSRARAAVLPVSPHFLSSKVFQEEELPRLLEAAAQEGLTILWINLGVTNGRPSTGDWVQYQGTHDSTKPLKMMTDPQELEQTLIHISEQISQAVQPLPAPVPPQRAAVSSTQWSDVILSYEGDPDFPAFESYRDEWLPVGEPERL